MSRQKAKVRFALRDLGLQHQQFFPFGSLQSKQLEAAGIDNLRLGGGVRANLRARANLDYSLRLTDIPSQEVNVTESVEKIDLAHITNARLFNKLTLLRDDLKESVAGQKSFRCPSISHTVWA